MLRGHAVRPMLIRTWHRCPYRPFLDLQYHQQIQAREHFDPRGRRAGWQYIQRWGFAVRQDGMLAVRAPIEPLGGDDLVRADRWIRRRVWDLANGKVGSHERIV